MLSYNVLNSWVEKMMKKSLPVKIKTSDITNLSTKDINKLKAGDIVLKKTGNQKHAYIVSYKEDNQGICLTYVDATLAETVSYDYNTTTKKWTYNSTDSTPLEGAQYTAGDNINIEGNVINAIVPNIKLYEHIMVIALVTLGNMHAYVQVRIFNNTGADMTINEVYEHLHNVDYSNYTHRGTLYTSGYYNNTNVSKNYDTIAIYAKDDGSDKYIGFEYIDDTGTIQYEDCRAIGASYGAPTIFQKTTLQII